MSYRARILALVEMKQRRKHTKKSLRARSVAPARPSRTTRSARGTARARSAHASRRLALLRFGGLALAALVLGVFAWSRRRASEHVGAPSVAHGTPWSGSGALSPRTEAMPAPSSAPTPSFAWRNEPLTPARVREEARELGARVLERFPRDPGALATRARVEYQLGYGEAAQEWWQRSLDLDATHAPSYRGLAMLAADRGDYTRVVALRRTVLDLEPASLQARTDLADALLKLGEPGEVVALLEEIERADPAAPAAFYIRGQAQLQLEDYDGAERSYRAAAELRPDWHVAYYGLITVFARSGRPEKSAEYMRSFQETRDRSRQVQKDMREAYDDASLMRQGLADAYTEAGDVYARLGALAEAEAFWERAAVLDAQKVSCRTRLSMLYERSGRDTEALPWLREVAALLPGNAQCHVNLGVVQARTGALDAAESSFREAIRVAPRASMGYRELARLLLLASRDAGEARALAEDAVRLEPSAENYAVLGASCEVNGDISGAIDAVERAMQLDPRNPEYPRIHAALRAK